MADLQNPAPAFSEEPEPERPAPPRRQASRRREWCGTLLSCGFVVAALAVFVPMLPGQDAPTQAPPAQRQAVAAQPAAYGTAPSESPDGVVARRDVSYARPAPGHAKHRI